MLNSIVNILWAVAIVFLLGGGIYFSFKLKFPQLRISSLFSGLKNTGDSSISPFKSLTVSLAARIGVGSLAGIAIAIYVGGPGSIFWIWIIGIITSINAFSETYLGLCYQEKVKKDFIGGPYYYILKGLKQKKMAFVYSVLVILAYVIGFMTIQANTIVISINNLLDINVYLIAIILAIITAFSIMKGMDRIVQITSKLVPIMGIGYILLSGVILVKNIQLIPGVLLKIVSSALNFKAFGTGILTSFVIGIQRGVFSTEAGLGTGSIATSSTYTKTKVEFSLSQILGIYFTVFVVCTSTALIILTSPYQMMDFVNTNGIELTQYALNYHLGNYGQITLVIIVFCLAYSTIVAGYYYGESALNFLLNKSKQKYINILKIITVIFILVGSLSLPTKLWSVIDLFVAFLAIINMCALIKLRYKIICGYKKYKKM